MAGSHAVRSVHADSSIEIGDYAIISTAGNNSSAVRVGEIDAARNLLISGGDQYWYRCPDYYGREMLPTDLKHAMPTLFSTFLM
ncbi:MAG: hypothetical protein ACLRXQ_10025 [Phascolarctobacterium faecium]